MREGGPPHTGGCHRGHGPWNDGLLRHLRRRSRPRRRHDALRQLLYRLLDLTTEGGQLVGNLTLKRSIQFESMITDKVKGTLIFRQRNPRKSRSRNPIYHASVILI